MQTSPERALPKHVTTQCIANRIVGASSGDGVHVVAVVPVRLSSVICCLDCRLAMRAAVVRQFKESNGRGRVTACADDQPLAIQEQ